MFARSRHTSMLIKASTTSSFTAQGTTNDRSLEQFSEDVLPLLRERAG